MAGRYVLDQTPQTVERYFGRYWTRLTTTNTSGNTVVTYTYSPRPLQRLFTGTENSTFKVVFVDNRAQQITLENMWTHDFDISDAARFFEYVFGYSPPQSEYRELGIENTFTGYGEYVTCLGDGVLARYNDTGANITFFVTLSYDQRCEPATPQPVSP
ncbi:MAG: hypothetical protein SFY66_28160 [Oculatellaceae cyanobacterium bins.114]|nr:hypothetical protein [Oculatellaceae cyanobacterium bins.114]